MGVEKVLIRSGNGIDYPKKHDEVSVEYTGWLFDDTASDNKGTQFDTSTGRGDLITPIGVGRVIRGWDEGIVGNADTSPMTLGEKSTFTITGDYAYGARGFPGYIPEDAMLIFDIELKAINGKRAKSV
jgi:FK506-binding protein 1